MPRLFFYLMVVTGVVGVVLVAAYDGVWVLCSAGVLLFGWAAWRAAYAAGRAMGGGDDE
ncbi:hypothetical protein LWF01_02755 [Saxibacter everestensis]|uniref:Uncharacterized protein n=1 Tax=Saxibacter everestensis TaxID=2909229 RepID=A0ABY8QUW6_9MICO|nr:hypothetical protein LWF01_02755 [Brevibacteriaceae bacterium ZFBP1038]